MVAGFFFSPNHSVVSYRPARLRQRALIVKQVHRWNVLHTKVFNHHRVPFCWDSRLLLYNISPDRTVIHSVYLKFMNSYSSCRLYVHIVCVGSTLCYALIPMALKTWHSFSFSVTLWSDISYISKKDVMWPLYSGRHRKAWFPIDILYKMSTDLNAENEICPQRMILVIFGGRVSRKSFHKHKVMEL